jgi:putative transposase
MKNESREYAHNNHSVGMATVHLVWVPKRRKSVLVGDIKLRLSAILSEVATERGWLIRALEIAPDHIHVLVEHEPSVAINQVVRAFKGRSSRLLRMEFSSLLRLPALWTHSYFYDTTGKVSTAKIQEYINDPHHAK